MRRSATIGAACLCAVGTTNAQSDFYVKFAPGEQIASAWQPAAMRPGVWDWWHVPSPEFNPQSPVPMDRQIETYMDSINAVDWMGVTADEVSIPARADQGRGVWSPEAGAATDPLFSQQWHLRTPSPAAAFDVHALGAWHNVVRDRQKIRVGVLDSGVWRDHPDLEGTVVDGWSAISGKSAYEDLCRHGTHVAGLIAAQTNNGIGIASLAEGADIVSLRVLDYCSGSLDDVTDGLIIGATTLDCDIISVSLQWGQTHQPWDDAIELLESMGVYVVVAAGNFGTPNVSGAARPEWAIAVGAHDVEGARPSWGNHGEGLELSAPGVDVLSTYPAGPPNGAQPLYKELSGTSMATPLVSATLANMISLASTSIDPSPWTPALIRQHLIDSADPSGNPFEFGAGYLNAHRPLLALVCVADFNQDGRVDFHDFHEFRSSFVLSNFAADLDANNSFDLFDFLSFQNAFATSCDH